MIAKSVMAAWKLAMDFEVGISLGVIVSEVLSILLRRTVPTSYSASSVIFDNSAMSHESISLKYSSTSFVEKLDRSTSLKTSDAVVLSRLALGNLRPQKERESSFGGMTLIVALASVSSRLVW